ncbi:replication-relaxation family protein [Rummeliibacillus stabekisii]|uniref:replication-relaxation family protein n=1 Tax=Rummeliibacillus stabekisii TaxID=241244 RepID=UPI0011703511|nr:replication-relaxation family protein [Rummeliibacillus stabekisii]MBB5171580.1 hypothetical protein [Rummeliibacillus stabekisii]GEL05548.1 hypothetical protein RST01_21750 [Rummeliibacillus stabekisii]
MNETTVNKKGKGDGIRLKRTERHNGIILHSYELTLVQHVYIHKVMRATSVHSLYQFLAKRNMTPVQISKRLLKLVNSGVLARLEERISDMSGNFVRYNYKLGVRGFSLLESTGYLAVGQARKHYSSSKSIKLPSFHTKAASVISNEIAMKCLSDPLIGQKMKMDRGANHYEFGVNAAVEEEMKGIIIPDYVFEMDDIFIAIEIDTGHQRSHIIKSKYERYKKKAESLKQSGKQIAVIFVVVDDSVASEAASERDKRVISLKNMFPPFLEWGDNLQFYALQASNAARVVTYLLSKKEPVEKDTREFLCEDWIDSVIACEQGKLIAERYSSSDFYKGDKVGELNLDILVKFSETEKYPRSYGLLYMYEGSVMSYQIYRVNLLRMEEYNMNAWKIHDVHRYSLLLLYEDSINVRSDVIGCLIPELSNVYLTDIDTWFQKQLNSKDESISPEIYEMVSTFKKEKRKEFRL